MGKIVGIVTPAGDAEKNASDLAKNVDFHIVLNEDFYKQFWIPQNGKSYESMIGKSIEIPKTDVEENKVQN